MAKPLKSEASSSPIRHPSKIRPVPLAQIRVPPVHLTQRAFRTTWGEFLAKNLDPDKLGYLVVNWRDGIYWCIDGQHRLYALKEYGLANDSGTIDCQVYENLTDAEAARVFLGRNNSLNVNTFDKFMVACTSEDLRAIAIRRAIESQNLKVSRDKQERCVSAISACSKVFDMAGEVVLGQTLRTVRDAFGGDPEAFDAQLIVGFGHVYNRYNGRTNEKQMVTCVSKTQYGARGILRRAEALREKTGNQKAHCVAAVIVEINNKGASRANKLPSWWKSSEAE